MALSSRKVPEHHVTAAPGQVARNAMFGTTSTTSYKGPRIVDGVPNKEPPPARLPPQGLLPWKNRKSDFGMRSLFFDPFMCKPVEPDSPNWRQGEPIIFFKDDGIRAGNPTLAQTNDAYPLSDFVNYFNGKVPQEKIPQAFKDRCYNAEGVIKYETASEFFEEWMVLGVLVPASLKTPGNVLADMHGARQHRRPNHLITIRVQGRCNVPTIWQIYDSEITSFPGEGVPCGLLVTPKPHVYASGASSAESGVATEYRLHLKPCSLRVAQSETALLVANIAKTYKRMYARLPSREERGAALIAMQHMAWSAAFMQICTPVASSGDFFPLDPDTGLPQPEIFGKAGPTTRHISDDHNSKWRESVQKRMFSTVFVDGDGHITPLGGSVF